MTTIWFWVPILFGLYVVLQIWMFFFLHPITLFIVPAIISIYGIIEDEKRAKAQYGLRKTKILDASHPLGGRPRLMPTWNVEQRVEEYLDVLEKKKKQAKANQVD